MVRRVVMARQRPAVKMTRLVAQWRASGEPQARFARRHGVRPWTLWYWSRKLGETSRAPAGPGPAFVPVQVIAEPPCVAAAIEVVLVSGERLTIPAGVSSDQMRAVLVALRSAC
jgi:transposase-like protein